MARASRTAGFPEARFVQIAGSMNILSGLDYHHHQFMLRVDRLVPYYDRHPSFTKHAPDHSNENLVWPIATDAEREHFDALDHEAVAYLNRIGQLFYFARSLQLKQLLPRVTELLSFRHKHTAHRSIDVREDESTDLLEMHAMSFGFHRLTLHEFPIYQIYDKEKYVHFHVRDDHPVVMCEAMSLLLAIHAVPLDA